VLQAARAAAVTMRVILHNGATRMVARYFTL
jgi:hypothetical protein